MGIHDIFVVKQTVLSIEFYAVIRPLPSRKPLTQTHVNNTKTDKIQLKMPKQTTSQKIGSLGHSIVETQVKSSKFWIARNLTEDFGIDMELEFAPEDVKGKFVKAQIKSHETIATDTDFISESLTKSFLRYVYECRVPIILVIVSVDTSKTWFIWLQKWIIDSQNISNIYDDSETKSLTVRLHIDSDFRDGLQRDIV